MLKDRVKELSYYLFFGLMVLAKGIGLDSGVRLYYILSAAACLCLGIKLVLTKYSIRQMGAMAFLCAIAFVSYRNSGRLGIVLTVFALIGLKDMKLKKLFRMGLAVYGCSFAWTVVMAKFGVIHNPLDVHVKGGTELIRWGMGYSTGNVFHVSYFILTVFLCYTWGKRYDVKRMLVLMAGNLAVFLFSLSYTGVIVTTFFLLIYIYAVKRRELILAERILFQLPLPLCLVFSFGGPFMLDIPLMQKVDAMVQARLSFSAYYLKNQPISLFGARMRDIPFFWVIMDNGYVYIFMTFGIVVFALFCAGYAILIARYSGFLRRKECREQKGAVGSNRSAGRERLPELSIIFSFLLYGIMEQFISNAFMNLSLLFLGEVLFGGEKEENIGMEKEYAAKAGGEGGLAWPKGWQWGCYIGAGAVIAAFYLAFVPAKEFVRVPLDSLLYVDAWSAEVSATAAAGNGEYTKKELKELMARCRSLVEETEAMQKAVREAGLEGKLSAEEAVAAMEYSIPMSVYNSGKYDRFRIRLLELYCGIGKEEYARLMEQIMRMLGQQTEENPEENPKGTAYQADADSIYQEKIGKSFGEDRIEHMSGEKEYYVEKGGNIVRMEHFRNGIFYGIAGMILLGSLHFIKKRVG